LSFFSLSVQFRKGCIHPPSTEKKRHHSRFAISGPIDIPLTSSIHQASSSAVDECWAKLALNIREIQRHNAHKFSIEECYKLGYQLVVNKHGQMLYKMASGTLSSRTSIALWRRPPSQRSLPDWSKEQSQQEERLQTIHTAFRSPESSVRCLE
jgi:hypothetical protein